MVNTKAALTKRPYITRFVLSLWSCGGSFVKNDSHTSGETITRASYYSNRQEEKVRETNKSGTLSIQSKIPEIPGGEANGTEIFRNKIPEFWVYLARLSLRSRKSEQPENWENFGFQYLSAINLWKFQSN